MYLTDCVNRTDVVFVPLESHNELDEDDCAMNV